MIELKKPWIYNIHRISPTHIPDNYIRLDKSERLLEFPDNIFSNFIKSLSQSDFSLYPNTNSLIQKIAIYNNVSEHNINLSFGSDLIIKSWYEVFCYDDCNIITSNPCFPMYNVYAKMHNTNVKSITYNENLKYNISDILNLIDNNTAFVILSNPNSPIGDYKNIDELEYLIKTLNLYKIPILIDEAYYEYNDYITIKSLITKYENLCITRTFSKAMGAAGCRIGYSISSEIISDLLKKFRPTFEATGPSIKFCEFLLDNIQLSTTYVSQVIQEKNDIINILKSKNFDVIDSNANWIHFNNKYDNEDVDRKYNSLNVAYKNKLSIPHDIRSNWIRLSIIPSMKDSAIISNL